MVSLTGDTLEKIRALFPPELQSNVADILATECGNNLPFFENADEHQLERIRFAVLKLSNGDLSELKQAIHFAKIDWRDVVVAAGFANSLTAHKEWRVKDASREKQG